MQVFLLRAMGMTLLLLYIGLSYGLGWKANPEVPLWQFAFLYVPPGVAILVLIFFAKKFVEPS